MLLAGWNTSTCHLLCYSCIDPYMYLLPHMFLLPHVCAALPFMP
jgi:hypothetical protein